MRLISYITTDGAEVAFNPEHVVMVKVVFVKDEMNHYPRQNWVDYYLNEGVDELTRIYLTNGSHVTVPDGYNEVIAQIVGSEGRLDRMHY